MKVSAVTPRRKALSELVFEARDAEGRERDALVLRIRRKLKERIAPKLRKDLGMGQTDENWKEALSLIAGHISEVLVTTTALTHPATLAANQINNIIRAARNPVAIGRPTSVQHKLAVLAGTRTGEVRTVKTRGLVDLARQYRALPLGERGSVLKRIEEKVMPLVESKIRKIAGIDEHHPNWDAIRNELASPAARSAAVAVSYHASAARSTIIGTLRGAVHVVPDKRSAGTLTQKIRLLLQNRGNGEND